MGATDVRSDFPSRPQSLSKARRQDCIFQRWLPTETQQKKQGIKSSFADLGRRRGTFRGCWVGEEIGINKSNPLPNDIWAQYEPLKGLENKQYQTLLGQNLKLITMVLSTKGALTAPSVHQLGSLKWVLEDSRGGKGRKKSHLGDSLGLGRCFGKGILLWIPKTAVFPFYSPAGATLPWKQTPAPLHWLASRGQGHCLTRSNSCCSQLG